MAYDKLIKETNMKNGIEGNISVFMRERVEGKEDGAKVIANVIAGSLDRNYKGQNNYKLLAKKITDKEITYIAKFLSEKITIDFSKNNVNNITERNIKDYFIIAHEKLAESLLSDKELKKLKIENPDDADYSKAKTNFDCFLNYLWNIYIKI